MQKHAARPRFEVADVVRVHLDDYRRARSLTLAQQTILGRIAACRTAALGGHLDACEDCGHARISYNSCRDRHCPKCQGLERDAWLERRLERLLPIPYFHVVFTIPDEVRALALGNKRIVFGILFRTAAATLQKVAADPKRLGAQVGVTAILHTWGQNLQFHPHLHCVVTGGGLSFDGTRWIRARARYLLPVQVLGRVFRGKFLEALDHARTAGELRFGAGTADLERPERWAALKSAAYAKEWNVYAKPPFGGPQRVFRYLGRYTHRVAISNQRITEFSAGRVTFTIKDYAEGGRRKSMTLDVIEFLRRFLLHLLPKQFVRIRHYGLNAGANVDRKLATARGLLEPGCRPRPAIDPTRSWSEKLLALTGVDVMQCPRCARRLLRIDLDPSDARLLTFAASASARAP